MLGIVPTILGGTHQILVSGAERVLLIFNGYIGVKQSSRQNLPVLLHARRSESLGGRGGNRPPSLGQRVILLEKPWGHCTAPRGCRWGIYLGQWVQGEVHRFVLRRRAHIAEIAGRHAAATHQKPVESSARGQHQPQVRRGGLHRSADVLRVELNSNKVWMICFRARGQGWLKRALENRQKCLFSTSYSWSHVAAYAAILH